ncbi:hypothetical protein V6N13_074994 [Hibiscus sabdariffa]|uniref:Uncharacterized protein n=1 Tax=Hibiscus sabdariffa TaxID=183260 RepID=A0ABR2UAX5_9ROSI
MTRLSLQTQGGERNAKPCLFPSPFSFTRTICRHATGTTSHHRFPYVSGTYRQLLGGFRQSSLAQSMDKQVKN